MITIDTNVPMPTSSGAGAPSKYPFADMEVGESFFIEGGGIGSSSKVLRNRLTGACARAAKAMPGKKFSLRMRNEDGTEGVRVWRVQ